MRLFLTAFALCAASAFLGLCALFLAALTAGPTVRSGERAAELLAFVDIALAAAAVVFFWRASRNLGGLARGLSTAAFTAVELGVLGICFLLSLLALNR